MKKFFYTGIVVTVGFIPLASASASFYDQSLVPGMHNNLQVQELQIFLQNQAIFSGPTTGNYGPLTRAAVRSFQARYGITANGYFGPITRARVRLLLANQTPATVTLLTPTQGNVQANAPQEVRWSSTNLPSGVGVDITLLHQITQSPRSYEVVRQIASNIPNSGFAMWTPMLEDSGKNLVLQVSCARSANVPQGCVSQVSLDTRFSVVASPSRNFASVITAP